MSLYAQLYWAAYQDSSAAPPEESMLGAFKSRFPTILVIFTIFYLAVIHSHYSRAQEQQPVGINWQKGPLKASLGGVATIEVPAGYKFTDAAGTKRLLELNQNPTSGNEVGLIMPLREAGGKDQDWFMLFEFHEVGYVSDSEKGSIDAPAVLESIKKGTETANETRREKGWTEFHVLGWSTQPYYDEDTHNLTWAILGDENPTGTGDTINHSVRLLGRRGTMSVDLVLGPQQLPTVLPKFNQLMKQFSFTTGNRYAEFVKGDKIAGYGLTALIAGGAAAAAVKTGLFAKLFKLLATAAVAFWKFIIVIFAALASQLKRFGNWIKGLFGKEKKDPVEVQSEEQLLLPKGTENDE
jgi:uncharacterized membrane-anchored protein